MGEFMNKDFDKELKEMASKSKVKESDKLKKCVSETCKNLKRKKKPVRKWIGTVAASIACVLTLGICFPTYAENILGIKQAISFLNSKFELEGYESNSTEAIYSAKAGEYTVNIEDVYYDGIEISVFYNITGENTLDKSSKYWIEGRIEIDKSTSGEYGLETGGFIDDNTYAGMMTYILKPHDGSELPEVFNGTIDIEKIHIQNANSEIIEVDTKAIDLIFDSTNIVVNEYSINEEIIFGDNKINIISVEEYPASIYIKDEIIAPINNKVLNYILWDSKKGEVKSITSYVEDDGTMRNQYRSPSVDGELYIIPYVDSSPIDYDMSKDVIDEILLEDGKKYDFGSYGTIEIKDIVYEGNETLMKVRITGYQARRGFNLINGKKGGYFHPAYEKDKTILGILDMEVTYVFNKLDPNENYYIEVPIEEKRLNLNVLKDEILKLELK